MNQPSDRDQAREHLDAAALAARRGLLDTATAHAQIASAFIAAAHLDALALPEPGTGDVILAAARKLTGELGTVEDHDHRGLTSGPDDHAQAVVPGAPVAAVATNAPSPVSPDAGNGSGEIRADLEALIVDTAGCVWNRPPMEVADAILAAGWRPPRLDMVGPVFAKDDESPAAHVAAYLTHVADGPVRASLAARGLDALGLLTKQLPGGRQDPAEDGCGHCSPTHERPESRPWGVYVAPHRDGDGQPTHLVVQPSNGAHVAQSDADWLWQLIRAYRPPAEARVFLPGDVVPAGLWISYRTPEGLAAAVGVEDWMAMDGAVVELDFPSLADWQAVVDRASAERREREQAHAAVLKADLGADVAREHGVLPDEDEEADRG